MERDLTADLTTATKMPRIVLWEEVYRVRVLLFAGEKSMESGVVVRSKLGVWSMGSLGVYRAFIL